MVTRSFLHMARGGIYDQVGGGFARYSVDAMWLVPHFEKMLYDNALLVRLGAHLWQATRRRRGAARHRGDDRLGAARDARRPRAASTRRSTPTAKGTRASSTSGTRPRSTRCSATTRRSLRAYWGVTRRRQLRGEEHSLGRRATGASSPRATASTPQQLDAIIRSATTTLYAARAKRVWPGRDDKILASWNGLMVRGIAEAARAFGDDALPRRRGRERRVPVREPRARRPRAALVQGRPRAHRRLPRGLRRARPRARSRSTSSRSTTAGSRARASSAPRWCSGSGTTTTGAFFDTASDHETLITRPRDVTDNAMPSGTSLAVELLVRLAELFADADARRRATYVVETLAPAIARYPSAFGHLLGSADMLVNGAVELAIVGDPESAGLHRARARGGGAVRAVARRRGRSRARDRSRCSRVARRATGRATAYVCRNYACEEPATTAGAARRAARRAPARRDSRTSICVRRLARGRRRVCPRLAARRSARSPDRLPRMRRASSNRS